MASSRRFLLVGHSGFYNRGCEAIVTCTVDMIRQVLPESLITLSSHDPEADAAYVREGNIRIDSVIPANPDGPRKPSMSWAWQGLCRRTLCRGLSRSDYLHRRYYKQADVVLSVGGDNFSDDYGSPERFFRTLDVAGRCGAKTVIWGASVGPFRPPAAERTWAEYMKKVDLITAREDTTVEYLANLGVTENVQRVCDPAFLLAPVEPKVPVDLGASNRMKVGLGMSALMDKYGTMRQYLDACVGFIESLVARHDAEILLVPHVIQEAQMRDDFAVCEQIARLARANSRCHVLPKTLNANELKHCIAKCHYFVGARTHSTIASLSSLVPTISIGYSVKAWGINHDLLGCDDYVVDINGIDSQVLIATFERLHEQRGQIVARLEASVPQAKAKAQRGADHLLSLICGADTCPR